MQVSAENILAIVMATCHLLGQEASEDFENLTIELSGEHVEKCGPIGIQAS